jgi:membrane protein
VKVMPVLREVKKEVGRDHVGIVAAGVAFYGLLSIFPALIALMMLYGLVADPAQAQQQIEGFSAWLPADARNLIGEQMQRMASGGGRGLGIGLVVGLAAALWSASAGIGALIEGINIAYGTEESRGFVKRKALALGLTLMALVVAVVMILAVAAVPILVDMLPLPDQMKTLLEWGRWPILALLLILGMAAIDYIAPCRPKPHWRWITPGALAAIVLWMAASVLFSVYVSNFGKYNETYGTLGAVIVLLMWLYIGAFATLLGAEINAEIEHAKQPEHVPA